MFGALRSLQYTIVACTEHFKEASRVDKQVKGWKISERIFNLVPSPQKMNQITNPKAKVSLKVEAFRVSDLIRFCGEMGGQIENTF